MAVYKLKDLERAVSRAEHAAQTFLNVSYSQGDFTRSEFDDIKTLKRRITDHLDVEVDKYSGKDGISVSHLEVIDRDVVIYYTDGSSTVDTGIFTDIIPEDPVSFIDYYLNGDDDLVQVQDDLSETTFGSPKGDPGNKMESFELLDSGDIEFTVTDGSTYTIGNIANFGVTPLTGTDIRDGVLYLQTDTDELEIGVVQGDRGDDGVIPVENGIFLREGTNQHEYFLNIPLDNGTTFEVPTPVPYELKTAEKEDALGLAYNNGDDVRVYLPTGDEVFLGNVHGGDGEDGDDGTHWNEVEVDVYTKRTYYSASHPAVTNFVKLGTEIIKYDPSIDPNNDYRLLADYPRLDVQLPYENLQIVDGGTIIDNAVLIKREEKIGLVYIPNTVTGWTTKFSTTAQKAADAQAKTMALRGIYTDIYADSANFIDAVINTDGDLIVTLSFVEASSGASTSVDVNVGKTKGDDGVTITDVTITVDGDVEVTYDDNGTSTSNIIGNIKYDRIVDVRLDPLTELITVELESGIKVETANSPHGSDGTSVLPTAINFDEDNEYDLSVRLSNNTSIDNIGKLRPTQDHTVYVNSSGDLSIKLAGETDETVYGNVKGIDGTENNVTGVTSDGSTFSVVINDGESSIVTQALRRLQGVSYDDTTETLTFTRDDATTSSVSYTRPDDGDHGIWVQSNGWQITDLNPDTTDIYERDGRLSLNLSDGSIVAFPDPIDADIGTDISMSVVFCVDGEVTVQWNDGYDLDESLGTLNKIHGDGGALPSTMTIEGTDLWTRDWSDGTPDTNHGQVVARWLEDARYNDTAQEIEVKWNTESDYESIGTIDEINADNARFITGMTRDVNGELEISWNDGTNETTRLDGLEGRYIDTIVRTDDTFVINYSDGSTDSVTIENFNGLRSKWIEEFVIDATNPEDRQFQVRYAYTDYDGNDITETDLTTIGPADGTDGVYITGISRDADDFAIDISDGSSNVYTIADFDGTDGVFVTDLFIESADGQLTVTWDDGTDEKLGYAHFDKELTDIRLNTDGYIEWDYGGTTNTSADVVDRRFDDASIDATGDTLTVQTSHLPDFVFSDMDGADVLDGHYPTSVYIDGQRIKFDISNGTTIDAGAFVRNRIVDALLYNTNNTDLRLVQTDGTFIDLGRVRGESATLELIDAFINQQYQLVLTVNNIETGIQQDPLRVDNVRGDDGNGIGSIDIVTTNGLSELVFTMDDTTTINLGVVDIDFGFAPYSPLNIYTKGQSVTYNGRAYVATRDGVENSEPTMSNDDWDFLRFTDDASPEAAKPDPISPVGGEVHPHEKPILEAGIFRNYYSPDKRSYREFQVDLASGIFETPVATIQENMDYAQIQTALDPAETYKWRARDVVDFTGYVTNWSDEAEFNVVASFILQPTVSVAPGFDSTSLVSVGGFETSAYSGSGTHTTTSWQIKRSSDGVVVYEDIDSTTDKTTKIMEFGDLVENTDYEIRVQHKDGSSNSSAWSEWSSFKTAPRFDLLIEPTISFVDEGMGDTITSTVARPQFDVSGVNEFWDEYMGNKGLKATWEVRDNTDALVWDSVSAIDIESVRVAEVLDSGTQYKVRVRYESDDFIGPSEWSDYVSFTPNWSIDAPVISYDGDISEVDANAAFSCSSFVGINETHRYTEWNLYDDTGSLVDVHYDTELTDSYSASFSALDSEKQFSLEVRHGGRFGVSSWGSISFTVEPIVAITTYTASLDNSAKKIDVLGNEIYTDDHGEEVASVFGDVFDRIITGTVSGGVRVVDSTGVLVWEESPYTSRIEDVHSPQSGDVYVVSGSSLKRLSDVDGSLVWEFTHTSSLNRVSVDVGGSRVYAGSTTGDLVSIDTSTGSSVWVRSNHTDSITDIHCDISGDVYASSLDGSVSIVGFSGGLLDTLVVGTPISSMGVSPDDRIVVSSGMDLISYDSTKTQEWMLNGGNSITGVKVGEDSSAYVSDASGIVRSVSATGGEIWEVQHHTGTINDLDVTSIVRFLVPTNVGGFFMSPVFFPPTDLRGTNASSIEFMEPTYVRNEPRFVNDYDPTRSDPA